MPSSLGDRKHMSWYIKRTGSTMQCSYARSIACVFKSSICLMSGFCTDNIVKRKKKANNTSNKKILSCSHSLLYKEDNGTSALKYNWSVLSGLCPPLASYHSCLCEKYCALFLHERFNGATDTHFSQSDFIFFSSKVARLKS